MNVYIWDNIDGLTSNYHSDGGLVIVASTIEAAQVQATAEGLPTLPNPTRVLKCASKKEDPQVFVFPNAGCC